MLVAGAVSAPMLPTLEKKLSSLHASKGPFSCCLLLGNLPNASSSSSSFSPAASHEENERDATIHPSSTSAFPLPVFVQGVENEEEPLPENVHLLPREGRVQVQNLNIACFFPSPKSQPCKDKHTKEEEDVVQRVVGSGEPCDIFLSSEWPEGVSNGLGVFPSTSVPSGNPLVSDMACRLAPRYHFTTGETFYQRPPYSNCGVGREWIVTRFLTLAPVSNSTAAEKSLKWMHALSLEPAGLSPAASTAPTASTLPCPYSASSKHMTSNDSSSISTSGERKRKVEECQSTAGGGFFFGDMARPRAPAAKLQPPSRDAKKLFVGGLPASIQEKELLQGFTGAVSARLPSGKSYAFVEFKTHDDAMRVVTESQSSAGVSVCGRPVTIGWGSTDSTPSRPPSSSARTLFIGGLEAMSPEDGRRAHVETELLGLFSGAVKVHIIPGKTYAFVDFATQEAARAVVEQYSADNQAFSVRSSAGKACLSIGWGQGRPAGGGEFDNTASHSADCWFCLASSSVKVHLIVSIGEGMYLSLPRGGVADWHVLIIPIACVSSRSQLPFAAVKDLAAYQSAIEKMFHRHRFGCLRFERALRTQGRRNHMQVHVVPLREDQVAAALGVFQSQCQQCQVHFHEVMDPQLSIEEFIANLSGGPYSEYFSIEIPYGELGKCQYKRYVFVHDAEERVRFPMSFGNEVAAKMIGQPERSNWKNCVQTHDQEVKLVKSFRDAFEEFDITR